MRSTLTPALQLDAAVGDQLAGADVDVVARAAAHVLGVDARAVLAEVEQEADLVEPLVEVLVALADLLVDR